MNRDLGQTLRLIAKHGDTVFYEGEIAHAIVDDMRAHGGLLTAEDLRGWRTIRNAPLWGAYRRYRVSSNQPPGGGVMLLEMLNILEHFDLASLGHNSAEYIRVVAEAMKRATDRQGPPRGRSRASSRCRSSASPARPTRPSWPPRSARAARRRWCGFNRAAPVQGHDARLGRRRAMATA